MTRGNRAVAAIVLTVLAAALFIGFKFHQHNPVDTDILSLLPGDRSNPALADALTRLNAFSSNRVTFLIEGGTGETRSKAAADLAKTLSDLGIFQSNATEGRAFWDWVFAHRTALLCPQDKKLLQDRRGKAIADDALAQWYAPFGAANSGLLKSDPMLLAPRLMKCLLGPALAMRTPSDAALVSGTITGSAFRTDIQDRLATGIADWQERWSAFALKLTRAGAVFHAAYGAESARWQMSVITAVTIGLILLIYHLVFGTIRPAFIAVASITSCLLVGLAVTLALFSQVHIMVIVFATALIGMVVDYSTYYLITGVAAPGATVAERRATLFRPLTLGMLTSVGAFAALLLAPIPAFRQIAILGGIGLFFAWAMALYFLPKLEGRILPRRKSADSMQALVNKLLARKPSLAIVGAAIVVTLVLAAGAWFSGTTLDDIRKFQAPSATLAAEEAHIRSSTGFSASGAFFLVTGASAEEAKAHEEELLAMIHESSASLVSIAASRIDPSAATLETQHRLIKEQLLDPELPGLLRQLNQRTEVDYAAGAEAPLPGLIASLRGQTDATFWSIVPVSVGAADVPDVLKDGSAWAFVDPAAAYSALLQQYRWVATAGLAGGAFITGIILLLVYRRWASLWVMLPTILAMIATPSILALLGLPYSFFSAMGLFLVIGAGVDYSIFQVERDGSSGAWTRLGIALAALMTCTSLGLLGFSSVLPVASFGLNVALGVFLSLVLSPIALLGRAR
jgi:predicted exporter